MDRRVHKITEEQESDCGICKNFYKCEFKLSEKCKNYMKDVKNTFKMHKNQCQSCLIYYSENPEEHPCFSCKSFT